MNTRHIIQRCGLISALLFLNGCGISYLADRKTNPSIQDPYASTTVWDYVKWSNAGVNTLSVTASRRTILVRKDDKGTFQTCAEPPPDVGEAFATAIADGITIAAKEPKSQISVEFANNYAKSVATQIAPLVYRTQGLQFYRDGLHDLCIARLNGWINDVKTYLDQKNELRKSAKKMIEDELKMMEKSQAIFYQFVKAGMGLDDLKKLRDTLNSTETPGPKGTSTTEEKKTTSGDTENQSPKGDEKEKSQTEGTRNGQGP